MNWLEIILWTIAIAFIYFNAGYIYSSLVWKITERNTFKYEYDYRLEDCAFRFSKEVKWMFPILWIMNNYQCEIALRLKKKPRVFTKFVDGLPYWTAVNNKVNLDDKALYLRYASLLWLLRLVFQILGLLIILVYLIFNRCWKIAGKISETSFWISKKIEYKLSKE